MGKGGVPLRGSGPPSSSSLIPTLDIGLNIENKQELNINSIYSSTSMSKYQCNNARLK